MSPASAPEISCDELACGWLDGDQNAETLLFSELRVRFNTIAKHRVQRDHLDDVVQDALEVVLRKGRQIQRRENVLVWSLTILRNVIGNHYQSRKRESGRMIQGEEALLNVADSTSVDIDLGSGDGLIAALKRLAESHPRCGMIFDSILKSHEQGGGQREISARALEITQLHDPGLTRGTFYTTLHRCRSRLKRYLDEQEGSSRE